MWNLIVWLCVYVGGGGGCSQHFLYMSIAETLVGWPALIGLVLKGPKHEIFESGLFVQIRPVRLGDLGTGERK